MTSSTEGRRASSSSPRGTSKGTFASRSVRFARTSRWAIVDSLTRNARAVSAVVRPPSSRRVSATRASEESSGWQQVNIRPSRSSPTSSSSAASKSARSIAIRIPTSRASSSCLRSKVVWRRARSIARFLAVAMSQARGLSGTPDSGQRVRAATSASWARSSARPTSRTIRARAAMRRADSIRQTASVAPLAVASLTWLRLFGGFLDLLRKVLQLLHAPHFDPAVLAGAAGGPLDRLLRRARLDQPVAADDLLGLRERPVGDGRLAAGVEADRRSVAGRVQAVEAEQHARLAQLLVVRVHRRADLRRRLPCPFLDSRAHEPL